MPIKTWATGDELLASDINTYLQQQMVQQFPNATARAAEIPIPAVGMITQLDDGGIEIFTDKTTPPSWRPPWSSAWGEVYNIIGSDVTLPTGAVTVKLTTGIPAQIAGRLYKIEYDVIVSPASTAGTVSILVVNQGGLVNLGQETQSGSWARRLSMHHYIAGSPTNTLEIQGYTTGSTASVSWVRVRSFDVGPA